MPLYNKPPAWESEDLKFNPEDDETSESERQAIRDLLQSPTPKRIYRQNNHGCYLHAPPAPEKLIRSRADDIVECAMRLMDLAMDQNRVVRNLEDQLNKAKPKSYDKYK